MHDWSREIRAAIASLDLEPHREAEVIDELSQHLRDRHEELVIHGMAPEAAAAVLRAELNDGALLSGLQSAVSHGKAAAALPPVAIGSSGEDGFLRGVWTDLRFGARLLRKNPVFTLVAILSLALGVGANTTIFQLLDAVRMRTLPVKAPEDLGAIRIVMSHGNCCVGDHYSNNAALTGALWERIRQQQEAFADLAAWAPDRFNLGQGGEGRYADTLLVSGTFFQTLGLEPVLGRLIGPADDYRGCGPQGAVLSYAFWQREFGGRPGAVGDKLTLNGHPFPIIGVAPMTFYGMEVGQKFDVALPICSQPVFTPKKPLMDEPVAWWIATVGRLKQGWTLERASAQLAAISPGIFAATLPAEYDDIEKKNYLSMHLGALPSATGVSGLRRDYEQPLYLLLALSGLVLLIACANLANLMLARASARQREMALRLTLGASRSRLIRQLLAESLMLATLGTIAGALLAQVLSPLLVRFISTEQNRIFVSVSPDWRVLAFAAALAMLTSVLFGLTPAIQGSRTEPGVVLKAGARGATSGRERLVFRRALVVSQVALSLVLVTGAFLFASTFLNLMHLDAGFQQDHVLITSVNFAPLRIPEANQMAFRQQLLTRFRSLPAVRSAAETLIVPLGDSGWDNNVDVQNGPQRFDVHFNRVSSGYFQTMQTALIAGRDFTDTDTPKSPRVAIVNEAFARQFGDSSSVLGKIFRDTGKADQTYQVIGLVKNTKYYSLREEPKPIAFLSFSQSNGPEEQSTFMVRSDEPLMPLIESIKSAAREIDPALVLDFSVFKTQIRDGLLRERLMATLSAFFGGLATLLAMIGLYGVISYMVVRRRSEIGVRMALGAGRGAILSMVLREAAALYGVGIAIGAGLSLAAGTAVSSVLYGLKASDPATLAAAIAGMLVVAFVASLLPAQRAASVHPMTALREE